MFLTFGKLNPLKTLQSVIIVHKEIFQSVSNLYYFAYILSIFLSFVHHWGSMVTTLPLYLKKYNYSNSS
jgi:hypothetical protein